MSSLGIAARLIRGQQNIDRMRQEIKSVIGMILGLLEPKDHPGSGQPDGYNERDYSGNGTGDCVWHIAYTKKVFYVTFHLVCPDSGDLLKIPLAGTLPENYRLYGTRTVEKIHDNLDVFVEGMLETFPQLRERIEPFLKAANKEF